jgi:hypothetical protein
MRALGTVVAAGVMLVLWSSGVASGAVHSGRPTVEIVADLDGRPIKSELISSFYCHDFAFPKIHCFRSIPDLRASELNVTGSLAEVTPSFGPNDYVTIFDGVIYSGSFMDVSQNYDALFSIGWNDRISSYKARNSAKGVLWTDWFASGTGATFCCNANVSSLPSNLDNAFSSVYRR